MEAFVKILWRLRIEPATRFCGYQGVVMEASRGNRPITRGAGLASSGPREVCHHAAARAPPPRDPGPGSLQSPTAQARVTGTRTRQRSCRKNGTTDVAASVVPRHQTREYVLVRQPMLHGQPGDAYPLSPHIWPGQICGTAQFSLPSRVSVTPLSALVTSRCASFHRARKGPPGERHASYS